MLSNDLFSCLTLLATAIRQSADRADFALMAKSVSTFADQFKLDCFGDLKMISGDIETIQDCATLAEGMEEEPLPQPSMYDTEGSLSLLLPFSLDHYDFPADYSPNQQPYGQDLASKNLPLDLSQPLAQEYYPTQTADLAASAPNPLPLDPVQAAQPIEILDPSQAMQAAQPIEALNPPQPGPMATNTMEAMQTASVAAAQRRGELEQAVQCVEKRENDS